MEKLFDHMLYHHQVSDALIEEALLMLQREANEVLAKVKGITSDDNILGYPIKVRGLLERLLSLYRTTALLKDFQYRCSKKTLKRVLEVRDNVSRILDEAVLLLFSNKDHIFCSLVYEVLGAQEVLEWCSLAKYGR